MLKGHEGIALFLREGIDADCLHRCFGLLAKVGGESEVLESVRVVRFVEPERPVCIHKVCKMLSDPRGPFV